MKEENKNYVYVIIGLGSILALTYLVILIKTIKHSDNSSKNVNTKKRIKKKKNIEFEDTDLINKFENFDDDDEKQIDDSHVIEKFEKEKKSKKELYEEDLTEDLDYVNEEIEQNIGKSDKIEETVSSKSKKNKFRKKEK